LTIWAVSFMKDYAGKDISQEYAALPMMAAS
jgi:hypothetical protein